MRHLLFVFLLTTLAACSTFTAPRGEKNLPLGTHYLPWPQRQVQLSAIHTWSALGSLAIHTDQKGWNASFNWQQQTRQSYTLALFGPFGADRMMLVGQPGRITLQTQTKSYQAATPEGLLAAEIGWRVPVSNLYYWIRGLPVPNLRARQSYDLNKHIVRLRQQDWTVVYLRYVSINNIDLPSRVLLENGRLQIRIVINQWNLS